MFIVETVVIEGGVYYSLQKIAVVYACNTYLTAFLKIDFEVVPAEIELFSQNKSSNIRKCDNLRLLIL